jgi:hypothetical protein
MTGTKGRRAPCDKAVEHLLATFMRLSSWGGVSLQTFRTSVRARKSRRHRLEEEL